MIGNLLSFVSFEPLEGKFRGFLAIESALSSKDEPEAMLKKATKLYESSIKKMKLIIFKLYNTKSKHKPVSASKIWQLGNAIFILKDELEKMSLQIDGIYDHLVRDLGVKRKWLEKVIILRRYLPDIELIPESLNWGRLEKGTRRKAERLKLGMPLS